MIRFYQRFISPLLPPVCRFYPSCSNYAIEVIKEWGVIKGSYLTIRRILRCHPLNEGGLDLPPRKLNSGGTK